MLGLDALSWPGSLNNAVGVAAVPSLTVGLTQSLKQEKIFLTKKKIETSVLPVTVNSHLDSVTASESAPGHRPGRRDSQTFS